MSLEDQRRLSFGKIVQEYDKYRPGYPSACLQTLIQEYGLSANSRVLEIGCGTGQFTSQLLSLGCKVDALDISEDMITFARQKFQNPNATFHTVAFEDFPAEPATYDAIVSATAFHWVTPEARTGKTSLLLKPGGVLAFLYNHYLVNDFRRDTEEVYEAILAMKRENVPMVDNRTRHIFDEILQSPAFTNGKVHAFPNPISYDTESYLGNMATHSFQNTLPEPKRTELFDTIRKVLEKHNGNVIVPYETRMYTFRKPGKIITLPEEHGHP